MNNGPLAVLVALDDSPPARAAVVATLAFPWPALTRVTGLVAHRTFATRGRPVYVVQAFHRAFARAGAAAEQALRRRWPDTTVLVVDQAPKEAILSRARRTQPDVIVLGSRRRGSVASALLGSVSRTVVHRAPCTVMVVRGRPHRFSRIVIGIDGSPNSRRAIELVRRLPAPPGGEVVLVSVIEPLAVPSMPLVPRALRDQLVKIAARLTLPARTRARQDLRVHERALRQADWRVRSRVMLGRPVEALLAAATTTRADALVVGARGITAVERLLVGSVAEGVLNRCPVTVVVVK